MDIFDRYNLASSNMGVLSSAINELQFHTTMRMMNRMQQEDLRQA